jgi:hypothetical protein
MEIQSSLHPKLAHVGIIARAYPNRRTKAKRIHDRPKLERPKH